MHTADILGLGIHIYSDQEGIFSIYILLYSDQEDIFSVYILLYSDQESIFVIYTLLYSDQEGIPWLIYSRILDQLLFTQYKISPTTYNICFSQLFIKRHTMLSSHYSVYMTSSIAHSWDRRHS